MTHVKLKLELLQALQEMYDMETVAPLMEFCHGEMRVLLYLSSNELKEICPSNLSDALFVTRQRITSILTALRKKSYVTMNPSEADRRRMQIKLTDTGKHYIKDKKQFIEQYMDLLIHRIGEDNSQDLLRLIRLCTAEMQK